MRQRELHRKRLQWLMANPSCWVPYKFRRQSRSTWILFGMLQQAGLYSRTTAWYDTAVDRLVMEARNLYESRGSASL